MSCGNLKPNLSLLLARSPVVDVGTPQYRCTLPRPWMPKALVTIRLATAQSVLGRSFTGWMNSGRRHINNHIVKKKPKTPYYTLYIAAMDLPPARLMALPWAFLLPSASARAFSSGWQIERAWSAVRRHISFFIHIISFKPQTQHLIHCAVKALTCWLAGKNP